MLSNLLNVASAYGWVSIGPMTDDLHTHLPGVVGMVPPGLIEPSGMLSDDYEANLLELQPNGVWSHSVDCMFLAQGNGVGSLQQYMETLGNVT